MPSKKISVLDWVIRHPFDDVDESEARIIVDFMALAVCADYEVHLYERIEINKIVTTMKLSWKEDVLDDSYVNEALDSAREAAKNGRVSERINALAAELWDGRYIYLFEMLARIVAADEVVVQTEQLFLGEVAQAFGIKTDMADEIVELAVAETEKGLPAE